MNKSDFQRLVNTPKGPVAIYDINELGKKLGAKIEDLPFSIKILVENLLRKLDGRIVKEEDLTNIAHWKKQYDAPVEIPFHPARVLMQDFTGVPAVVDLAAMRDAVKNLGEDPKKVNPLVPVELVVDHSVQIDHFGEKGCLEKNVEKEYQRNGERYMLLKWAQKNFDNFKVVPPNSGICHQVNLEYLGRVVMTGSSNDKIIAFPDTLVGTDSHTTMINGIGVMGWGVGGIEAEAVMLGQPYYMSIPEVIGVRLSGHLNKGITATDLVLTITELLRKQNVVEKFVEFFGPGMKQLPIPDRATVANMSPEYGATMGFFPVDDKTIDYLKITHREEKADVAKAYTLAQGMFYTGDNSPVYSKVVDLDLSTVKASLAGPARPQDRIVLNDMKPVFADILGCEYDRDAAIDAISTYHDESGCETVRAEKCIPVSDRLFTIDLDGKKASIGDGSVVVAAITSCTNTSNPHVLIGAGLIAENAVKKGLIVPSHVKTSLAPGSRVVEDYLKDAEVLTHFEALGFHISAFGCTTCIGNSGPLDPEIEKTIIQSDLNVAAVLSGNRNFEARIHQHIKSNFLASPMLVVAFALAGRVDIDLGMEPVGIAKDGTPVYLDELWPEPEKIDALVKNHVKSRFYKNVYDHIFDGDDFWKNLPVSDKTTYSWDPESTYIKNPPYFKGFTIGLPKLSAIDRARAFLLLGDSVTTDHISPAGAIPSEYPAGRYLIEKGVSPDHFNSYGSRRGNHEVMMRGTFGNIRIKNKMVAPKEGSYTIKHPEGREMFNYEAAIEYMEDNTPLIVLGGREYGTGSSRDWAAKGSNLLGIRAVIAASFERIHRNNLVGMGVLPLMFLEGQNADTLNLDGSEAFNILGIENMMPRKKIQVNALKGDGTKISFDVISRLDTDVDVAYFEHQGILPYVLRKMMD